VEDFDWVNLFPLKELREFRVGCMKEDIEEKVATFPTDLKLLGMKIALTATYNRPKLTPEEERAIEEGVGRRWDAAHVGLKPTEGK
jgi:hypothetical protein